MPPSLHPHVDRMLDEWATALEAVRSDAALTFHIRRLCLSDTPRRVTAASQLAARMRRGGEADSLVRFAQALADPRMARAVLDALPEPPPPKRKPAFLWIFLGASLLLHPLLIGLFLLLWILFRDATPLDEPPRPRALTVTLAPRPEPPPPPVPPQHSDQIPFLDTTGLPRLAEPDPVAAFEGETNTAAMSRTPGANNPALPNQMGEVRPGIELFNSDYSPEQPSHPSEVAPQQPQQKPPTPEQTRPAEPATASTALKESLRTNPASRIQTGEKTEAEKAKEKEKERATAATPPATTAAEDSPNPAAFSAFKRQNRIEGGAAPGEVESAAARESEIGRYKAKLYRAIGSRWYAYVRQDDGKLSLGVVRLRFYVRHDGVILPPEIVDGSSHAALLAVSRRSVMEVSGQLEPFPPTMRQQMGEGYYEEVSFSIY